MNKHLLAAATLAVLAGCASDRSTHRPPTPQASGDFGYCPHTSQVYQALYEQSGREADLRCHERALEREQR